jgi:hypothetical protein
LPYFLQRLPGAGTLLAHYEWIVLIIFQSQAGSAHYAFQWIVCHVYGQLDLLAQSFIQSAQQGASSG